MVPWLLLSKHRMAGCVTWLPISKVMPCLAPFILIPVKKLLFSTLSPLWFGPKNNSLFWVYLGLKEGMYKLYVYNCCINIENLKFYSHFFILHFCFTECRYSDRGSWGFHGIVHIDGCFNNYWRQWACKNKHK